MHRNNQKDYKKNMREVEEGRTS